MTVKFTNNASSTVGTGINTSATSLTVASASAFPQLAGADDYCYLTIQGATSTTREVVKATALSSNTFTIVRAQDNTSAGTWSAGDIVELRLTSALLQDVIDQATVEGIKTNFQYIPTANQTAFDGADNSGDTMIINDAELVNVYMNGVRLVQGSDYTVSSSNNRITLSTGATTADVIDIEVFGNFTGQSGAAVAITGGAIAGTAITGGSINNTPIGATQANTVAATTLTANSVTANNFLSANNNTDDTNKEGHFLARQYDSGTETEGFQILQYFANSSANRIDLGGASSQYNAASEITFNTAANTTTRTGTQRLSITSAGATFSGSVTAPTGSFTRLDINATNTKLKGDLLAHTDAAYDIGASGANRPRNLYLSNSITAADITTTGAANFSGTVGMPNGYATAKFAVGITGVHGSYDLYNNGTTYLNGAAIVDDNLTVSGSVTSSTTGNTFTHGTSWGTNLALINTNDDASPSVLSFQKTPTSGYSAMADNDYIGFINFRANNSANQAHSWVEISAFANDVTDGSEGSSLRIGTWGGGTEYANTLMLKSGEVGIGTSSPSSYYSSNLVVGAADQGGITIAASGTTNTNYLLFADGTSGDAQYRGQIAYQHDGDKLNVVSTGIVQFMSGSGRGLKATLSAAGNLNIGMPAGYNAEGKLHVYNGASGKSYAADGADQLILENSGSVAMDIRTPNANNASILFSDQDARGSGQIIYSHSVDKMYFYTGGGLRATIFNSGMDATGYVRANGLHNALGSDFGSQQSFWADANGYTYQAGYQINWNTGANSARTYKMRLDQNGHLLNYATSVAGQGVTTYGNGANGHYISCTGTCNYWVTNHGVSSTTGTLSTFYNNTTAAGSITIHNTSDVLYGGTSDYRRKENVVDMVDATARLKQLRPITFNWIEGGAASEGFLAHEVQTIVPTAVTGAKDQVFDEEDAKDDPNVEVGDIKNQMLDPAKLVPMLVKAMQEQQTIIESLTARVTELENN